jgi:hypothetical protein
MPASMPFSRERSTMPPRSAPAAADRHRGDRNEPRERDRHALGRSGNRAAAAMPRSWNRTGIGLERSPHVRSATSRIPHPGIPRRDRRVGLARTGVELDARARAVADARALALAVGILTGGHGAAAAFAARPIAALTDPVARVEAAATVHTIARAAGGIGDADLAHAAHRLARAARRTPPAVRTPRVGAGPLARSGVGAATRRTAD